MDPTRRTLLKGLGGIAVGGVTIANLQTEVRSAIGKQLVPSSGRAAAISVSEDNSLDGFSDVVTISAVDDPATNGDNEENDEDDADDGEDADGGEDDGDGDAREGVIHITSIPSERTQRGDGDDDTRTDNGSGENQGDGTGETNAEDENESDDAVTLDYGISVVNVRDRELTVADIYDYEGDDSSGDNGDDSDDADETDDADENGTTTDSGTADDPNAGFAYDWYTTDRDIVSVDTDREQIGGGPDEAWLLLQSGGNGDEGDTGNNDEDENGEDNDGEGSGDENGDGGDDSPDPSIVNGLTLLFRTMYADEETGEWHTRTVSDEFQDIEGQPWKRLSVSDREFVEVGFDLLEEYGDATVHAVGVGRGDPFWGPSKLDTYYHDLQLNGETYTLPTTYENEQGEGSDDSDGTVTPDGGEV